MMLRADLRFRRFRGDRGDENLILAGSVWATIR